MGKQTDMELDPLNLFTPGQIEQLFINSDTKACAPDHYPVAIFMSREHDYQWMVSELRRDTPDIAYGIQDLGNGNIQLQEFNIREIVDETFAKFGKFDSDILIPDFGKFNAEHSISTYYEMSKEAGELTTENLYHLNMLSNRLHIRRNTDNKLLTIGEPGLDF